MKRLLIVCAALLLGASVSFGQTPDSTTHKSHNGKHHNAAYKQLNLTADQKSKLKEYSKNSKAKHEQITNDASLTREQKTAQLKQLKQDHKKEMASVLTDEQKQKMKTLRAENKKHSPHKSTDLPNTDKQGDS
jgi:Spy/CpxP family protein refolding chaperone